MKQINIKISENAYAEFHNNVDFCVGTGRMGLALQKEYYEQLKLVQENIGFRHIRGHGLFCDDMGIYQESTDENGNAVAEYNYTYLDRVFDMYRSLGLKPFLELGFMPEKIASGKDTVFYWKGNITPPKSYAAWTDLVKTTLEHLIERYGAAEVTSWPVEVWNEPNLTGFWKNADMEEYFRLFKETFYAVKEVDKRFRVGGPAVCGGTDEIWIKAFLEYCRDNHIQPDFVTRHHYTCEISEDRGHYRYPLLSPYQRGKDNLRTTRDIIDSFDEFRGLEIHITEFNTSWDPRNVIHDTNKNAAYIANQLSWLGDLNESYSYWTFGDVFEEQGIPWSVFYGGFGMVASGCIPKPTFYTFKFFSDLKRYGGECVYRAEDAIIVKKKGGFCGVLWNSATERSGEAKDFSLTLPAEKDKEYFVLTQTVDEKTCNPLKLWHNMGEPKTPCARQLEALRAAAAPFYQSYRIKAENNKIKFNIEAAEYGVVWFEVSESAMQTDRGYDYSKVNE